MRSATLYVRTTACGSGCSAGCRARAVPAAVKWHSTRVTTIMWMRVITFTLRSKDSFHLLPHAAQLRLQARVVARGREQPPRPRVVALRERGQRLAPVHAARRQPPQALDDRRVAHFAQ